MNEFTFNFEPTRQINPHIKAVKYTVKSEQAFDKLEKLVSNSGIYLVSIGRYWAAFDAMTCAPVGNCEVKEVIWSTYQVAITHLASCIVGKEHDLICNNKSIYKMV